MAKNNTQKPAAATTTATAVEQLKKAGAKVPGFAGLLAQALQEATAARVAKKKTEGGEKKARAPKREYFDSLVAGNLDIVVQVLAMVFALKPGQTVSRNAHLGGKGTKMAQVAYRLAGGSAKVTGTTLVIGTLPFNPSEDAPATEDLTPEQVAQLDRSCLRRRDLDRFYFPIAAKDVNQAALAELTGMVTAKGLTMPVQAAPKTAKKGAAATPKAATKKAPRASK